MPSLLSSERARAEINSPTAVPAIASVDRTNHWETAGPGIPHHAWTIANSNATWISVAAARTINFEEVIPRTRRLNARSRWKMVRSLTSSFAAALHPNQKHETASIS